MAGDRLSDEERALIDAALSEGNVTRYRGHRLPGAGKYMPAPEYPPRVDASKRKAYRPPEMVSIREALNWAFGVEFAQMDLPEREAPEDRGYGFGTEYLLLQRLKLGGVRIDTSPGRSEAHADAQILASLVAAMPRRLGGAGMAVQVAEWARSGLAPDWLEGASPRVIPEDVKTDKLGRVVAVTDDGPVWVWYEVKANARRGTYTKHRHEARSRVCRVQWEFTREEIDLARSNYRRWVEALAHVAQEARKPGVLGKVGISDELPPLTPWA